MDPETKRAAGFLLYRQCGEDGKKIEFLLLQASDGIHHWSPPKGHLETGEDEMTAAIRETWEEAGIEKDHYDVDPSFRYELQYIAREKPKIVTYFLAKMKPTDKAVKLSHEHENMAWLLPGQAAERLEFDDMKKMVASAMNYLGLEI